MQKPGIPPDEDQRYRALCRLDILDTPPEARFDRVTRLAQRLFGTPIALVSLVDAGRQWFKSRQGLEATETPRDISFCGHAILGEDVFVVTNAVEDPRFADNPLVTGPLGLRFYAGAPLHAPGGARVGTLCIIDQHPRDFPETERSALRDLADCIETELERTHLAETARRERHLTMVVERTSHGVAIADAEGRLEWVNKGFESITGYALSEVIGKKPGSFLQGPGTDPATVAHMRERLRAGVPFTVEIQNYRKDGRPYWVSLSVQPVQAEDGRINNFIAIQNDITKRKQAESQIRSGEQRIRAIVENVVDGILTIDAQGTMQTLNSAVERIFGYPKEELLGRNVNILMPEPYHDAHDGYLQHYLTTGERKVIGIGREVQGRRKDGSVFPMDLAVGEMEVDGQRMFTGIVRDISERKEAEARLHASTALRQAILDSANVAIISTDPQGLILTFNRAAERILGYPAREMEGLQSPAVFHDLDEVVHRAGELTQELGRRIEPGFDVFVAKARLGQHEEREWTYIRKDGSRLPVLLSVTALRDADEEISGFLGIAVDITQRRGMEERLKQFESIVQSSDDAIISKTLDGLVRSWNPAAERMFGYSAQEMIGRPMRILFPPELVEEETTILARIGSGEKVLPFETVRRRKDGSSVEVSVTVSPILDTSGRVVGASKIARDISDRKRLEKMKNEFISTVSHELRTPLTSIRGALGLVMGKAGDAIPERFRKLLEMAERNSERLTLLINDILDLEKIEGGRLEFEIKALDLVALANKAVEDNEGFARKHQVHLVLDHDLPKALVRGDEHRLLQAFANLISNAIKFSPPDGTIEVTLHRQGDTFRLGVQDHGPGIPEHFRERIFQRFAQADSSDSREKGGTGLGLSITKAIIERHEGRIGYETELGAGTLFHFDLPVLEERTEAPETTGPRALICEDDGDVAHILEGLLKAEGLVCDLAATAEAARGLLGRHAYRLMLLDLTLPDADGLQFLQELRQEPATGQLPVIVVSGRAREGRAAFSGNALSVVDWLQKPVDQKRLSQALRQALQHFHCPRILHVEDDIDIVHFTRSLLEGVAEFTHVASKREALESLTTQDFDLVILDLGLPDGSGLELLDQLKGRCPVVIFSALVPTREIIQKVNSALTKSTTSNEQLLATIKRALAMKEGET